MKRREFIALVGGTVAWPVAARAQQAAMPVIGYLGSESYEKNLPTSRFRAFHQGLAEAGYTDGSNVKIEYRWVDGRFDQLQTMVAELVRRQVKVIVSLAGISLAQAAKAATSTIPIVFEGGFDPVQQGIVESLARPAGNLTGVSSLNVELGPKRLEIMHELLPKSTVIGLLINPSHPLAERQTQDLQAAALSFERNIRVVHAKSESEFDAAFASAVEQRVGGLVIPNMLPFPSRAGDLGTLADRHGLPAIFQSLAFTEAGGLVSYSANTAEAFRLVGAYTGRILNGAKPADLPVQRLTKVEMIINLKAAKTLGIRVPLPLLGRSDKVIE